MEANANRNDGLLIKVRELIHHRMEATLVKALSPTVVVAGGKLIVAEQRVRLIRASHIDKRSYVPPNDRLGSHEMATIQLSESTK